MANIRVDSPVPVYSGQPLTFKSPKKCTDIAGLIVYYPNGSTTASKVFQFSDAHGNNVGGKDLFGSGVLVRVILEPESNRAYVQNADTNSHLENLLKNHSHPVSAITGLDALLSTLGKIQTGSYAGAGTCGSANPCTLTFDFAPALIWIYAVHESDGDFHNVGEGNYANYISKVPMGALTTEYKKGCGFGFSTNRYGKKSSDGKTVYWYSASEDASNQLNESGATYYYLAIGQGGDAS